MANGLLGGGNGPIPYQRTSILRMIIVVNTVLKARADLSGSWLVLMNIQQRGTIAADKAILFPILNSECSYAEFPGLNTEEELGQCAKQMQDSVVHLEASIDGVPISGQINIAFNPHYSI